MLEVHLSLGSNIRPRQNLAAALERLDRLDGIRVTRESAWYETRPWGGIAQPNFLNLVCAVETSLWPTELLRATQEIERQLGRTRILRNGPRTIDIDILLAEDLRLDTSLLEIPHPGLLERDFMLIPLLELEPEAKLPESGAPLIDSVPALLYRQIVRKVDPGF